MDHSPVHKKSLPFVQIAICGRVFIWKLLEIIPIKLVYNFEIFVWKRLPWYTNWNHFIWEWRCLKCKLFVPYLEQFAYLTVSLTHTHSCKQIRVFVICFYKVRQWLSGYPCHICTFAAASVEVKDLLVTYK